MATVAELERLLHELTERVRVLEDEHHHQMGNGLLNAVGVPVRIKNGMFKPLRDPKPLPAVTPEPQLDAKRGVAE